MKIKMFFSVIFAAVFSMYFTSCNTAPVTSGHGASRYKASKVSQRARSAHRSSESEVARSKKPLRHHDRHQIRRAVAAHTAHRSSKPEAPKKVSSKMNDHPLATESGKEEVTKSVKGPELPQANDSVEKIESTQTTAVDSSASIEPTPIPEAPEDKVATTTDQLDIGTDNVENDELTITLENPDVEAQLLAMSRAADSLLPLPSPIQGTTSPTPASTQAPIAKVKTTEVEGNVWMDRHGPMSLWLFGTDPIRLEIASRELRKPSPRTLTKNVLAWGAKQSQQSALQHKLQPKLSQHGDDAGKPKIEGKSRYERFVTWSQSIKINWGTAFKVSDGILGLLLFPVIVLKLYRSRSSMIASVKELTWRKAKHGWLDFWHIWIRRPVAGAYRRIFPKKDDDDLHANQSTPPRPMKEEGAETKSEETNPYAGIKFKDTDAAEEVDTSEAKISVLKVLPPATDDSYESPMPVKLVMPSKVITKSKNLNELLQNIEELGSGYGLKSPHREGKQPGVEIRSHIITIQKLIQEYKRPRTNPDPDQLKELGVILKRNLMNISEEIGLRKFISGEIRKEIPGFRLEPIEVQLPEEKTGSAA